MNNNRTFGRRFPAWTFPIKPKHSIWCWCVDCRFIVMSKTLQNETQQTSADAAKTGTANWVSSKHKNLTFNSSGYWSSYHNYNRNSGKLYSKFADVKTVAHISYPSSNMEEQAQRLFIKVRKTPLETSTKLLGTIARTFMKRNAV